MGNWLNFDKVAHYWNRGDRFLDEDGKICVTRLYLLLNVSSGEDLKNFLENGLTFSDSLQSHHLT